MNYKYSLDDINEKDEGTVFSIKDNKTGEEKDVDVVQYIDLINKGELEA